MFFVKKRLWTFYGIMFMAVCALAFRIFTISDGNTLHAASGQSSVTVTVGNTRGTIYDRNRVPFVNSQTEYRASVTSGVRAISALSEVLDTADFEKMSKTLQNGKPAVVSLTKLAAAEGITLFQLPKRYGSRVLAPHLIGYMDGGQIEGLVGLEKTFNELLTKFSGTATVKYTVDATGKPLSGIAPQIINTINNSKGGVVLTLDATIQETVEDIASKHMQKGAVVVMSPESGEILAMASLPTYQPTTVTEVLNREDAPLLNRAICSYNCGSVFKIVSAAAALETGVSTNAVYRCFGHSQIGDTRFHCHERLGHGALSMPAAFAKSCNCYFIELMQDVGSEALFNMSSRLQFDSTLSLCEGFMSTTATLPTQNDLVSPAVLANLSFGQGELTATPLHIAQLISTVVNDGTLTVPKLIYGYMDEGGNMEYAPQNYMSQQVFSAQTAQTLRDYMIGVVEEGGTGFTGKPSVGGAGAKTGTAETGWAKKENEQYDVVQSWYAGFYPAQNPQYVIVALAENAQNTHANTAAVFKEIADALYQYKKTTE